MTENHAHRLGFLMMELLQRYYWLDDALTSNLTRIDWSVPGRSQSLILIHVALGIDRTPQIARNLGVSRQAMSHMVKEMRARHLIDVIPDPADKRASRIRFSDASAQIQADAMAIIAHVERTLSERIGKSRVRDLYDILRMDWGVVPVFGKEVQTAPARTSSRGLRKRAGRTPP